MSAHAATHHHHKISDIAAMQNEIKNIKKHYAPTFDMIKWVVGVGIATVLALTGIVSGHMLNVNTQFSNISQDLRDIRKESVEMRKETVEIHKELARQSQRIETLSQQLTVLSQKMTEQSQKMTELSQKMTEQSQKIDSVIANQKK